MFANSPFQKNMPIMISKDTEIVFVSDMFVEDYIGGAELTTEALIKASPFNTCKIHSKDLTMELLEQGVEKYWIFGNFAAMPQELIPSIVGNLEYSILEYDYKYCKWRSAEKHKSAEKEECDCAETINGKMVSALMYGAKSLWWMSERQMEKYHTLFPFLEERNNVVLSSIFDEQFWLTLKILREKYENVERKNWVVLGSTSWIKGAEQAEQWCKDQGHDYEVLWDISHETVLEKLAQAEGFVYLPLGGDTCPRMVIEAKLLGCKLHINDYVEHAEEIWFDTDDMFDTEAYLYAAREKFWNGIKHSMSWTPFLSGYTTTLNCIDQKYPFEACIQSMLGFCDEVIVTDGGSSDGTWALLEGWSAKEERLKIYQNKKNWDHPRFAVFDGTQKAYARSKCQGEYCWQQDSDEVIHEKDYDNIRNLMKSFPSQVDIVCLPVIEFWGGNEKVRMDVNPWKWRMTKNKHYITHGIPAQFRKYDDDGNLYASMGTDGCDYIDIENGESLAHASFYTNEAHNLRVHALMGNEEAFNMYQDWFGRNVETLPSVYHYSWYDLGRKIRTYRDYWSSHWKSLYNITQEDTPENNMFFNKAWKDVTEKDIDNLAVELKEKMGGWVFHERVDFSKPTKHLELDIIHPQVMKELLSE